LSDRQSARVGAELGPRLRAFRESANLTQQQLATELGCSRKQVGRWEIGETTPKKPRLAQMEGPLGLAPGTLAEILDSLDSQARGHRMRRVSQLFEEGFGSETDLAEQALGDLGRTRRLTEGRLATGAEVVEALIQLSVLASRQAPGPHDSVTLIAGDRMARHIDRANAKRRWKRAIQALLAGGWRIQHLWCGTEVPIFEEWIVDFLGFEGRYELYSVGRGGLTPSFVLLDIPGVGGLIAFVRRDNPDVSAWASTEGPILELVHDAAIYALGAGQVEPSRQFTQFEGREEMAPGLTSARLESEVQHAIGEKLPGEQLLLRDGFSNLTMPEEVAIRMREKRLAGAGLEQAAAIRSFYETRLQRVRRFEEWLVQHVGIRAICSLEAIDEFMATGSWPMEALPEAAAAVDDPLLRRAWIANVVRLLKDHPRTFQLGLVDRQTRPLLDRAEWKTVGDRCLLFTVGASSSRTQAYGHSFDPGVVATFRGIFEDVWGALPQSARDTRSVIARLERAVKRRPRAASRSPEPVLR
jgi:transcriptional regulator with XRE-family HTH domain